MFRVSLVVLLLLTISTASAQSPVTAPVPVPALALPAAKPPPSPARRAAAIGLSLVPGVLVHGAGSWAAGDRATARTLLTIEVIGLGALTAGAAPLLLTYGSDEVTSFAVPLILAGGGLFLGSWAADIYGAAGGACLGGVARAPARFTASAGAMYIRDPIFAYGAFATVDGSWQGRRLRIAPSLAIAAGADNQRGRVELGWRLGESVLAPGALTGDQRVLEIVGAVTGHRYGDDDFWLASGELGLHLRQDLGGLASSLAGAFAEGTLGLGLELAHYAAGGEDVGTLGLGRFGVGVYLGDGRGEVQLHYDHRRDGFAGGLAPGHGGGISRTTSFIGSIGVGADVALAGPWALTGGLEIGSAYVTSLSLRYRGGLP